MDPFTEKLLERTRARRENLQKKMAERPNAANRPMVKRPRDPLTDTNNMITEAVTDKVPQPLSKLSPYKRRCSGENVQPTACEENQEQMITQSMAPVLLDPPTDKKPPMGPGMQSSSLDRTATRTDIKSQSGQRQTLQPELEKMAVTAAPDQSSGKKEPLFASSAVHRNKEDLVEDPAPHVAGMKSRLQRLAEQRKYWDGDSTADGVAVCTPPSPLKRQAEVPPAAISSVSSETSLGRKGRLANLAATIGSWEDDLSHVNIPKENKKQKPCTTVPKLVATSTKPDPADSHLAACSKSTSSSKEQDVCSLKSSQVLARSPKKDDGPAPQSVTSPQKSSALDKTCTSSPQECSNQVATLLASPPKASPPPTASVPKSPFTKCGGLNLKASPRKPELCAKPALVGPSASEEKTPAGGPSVKSFLERFGERCQERTNQASPAGGTIQAKTPTVAPSVTPNTKLVQERLRAAQGANTTTADLTQRQKMERESELAKIRSCFQNGNNMWKNDGIKMKPTETKKNADIKEQLVKPIQPEMVPDEPNDDSTATSTEITDTPSKRTPPAGHRLVVSPPALTSSPLRVVAHPVETPTDKSPQKDEMITEIEMNVDQSINSAVISELFDGVLEQSEDEDDEEDALNISSMSLLTPLAETVAAVVKSPEKKMMTSTPASSFLVKSPDNVFKPSKFQRTNLIRTPSSDSVEALDEEHKLPYSIDAYRSTRVKEPERPSVKQVIVRNEDVSHRAQEPRGSSLFSIKQKIKILTNEINMQQTVIHQASQALNCCTDEEHGKGSLVEAEAERLLLVAVERRLALREELDRLKGGVSAEKRAPAIPESISTSASKGTITLQNLQLPLKADFVCSTANKPESTKHSFFIMIRAGAENTVASPLATTHCGLSGDTLTFPTKFTLSNVSSDFVIDIEVYGLVQKREGCSDKKKPSKSKAITPKRFLGISKSVQTPVVASPGGPNAIRTSNFGLVGSHKITLSSIGKNKFPLEKVPFLCPLEGHINLMMQCEVGSKVEERGFLTMFEDVSGFGAWHRRWCVLSGYYISYWTYPDDEKRKNPLGRINLSNCSSNKVEPANREFCARPNTFELITVRPQRDDDKETLVSQCMNTMCVTKHWLSADTKDERNLWMKKLNQIVVDLRMWQPGTCYRPL